MTDIQRTILEIFKEFDRLCNKYNIPYYAIGGTCIGAIRHNGFIPWDDDMDVAIPIEEFDRFISIAKEELPPYYKVFSSSEVQHYRYLFIKIIDTRTTFIEKLEYEYEDSYKGIFLDIMPISGIPENLLYNWLFRLKQSYYYVMNNTVRYPLEYVLRGNNVNKAIWKYAYFISKVSAKKPFYYYTDKWMKMLRDNPFNKSKLSGYVWNNRLGRLVFNTEVFGHPVRIPFEDTTILCPENSDSYLSAQFGDYMKLPPVDQQVSVHPGIVSIEKPYKEFIGKLKEI